MKKSSETHGTAYQKFMQDGNEEELNRFTISSRSFDLSNEDKIKFYAQLIRAKMRDL